MSKAEAKAWADLAEAARRVQRFQNRRKNARGKPKMTKEQRKEAERKRIEFAIATNSQLVDHPYGDKAKPYRELWIEAARQAKSLGLYSKNSSDTDVACSLYWKKYDALGWKQ